MVKTTLGIIGGGQLGSMLATAAKRIDIKTVLMNLFLENMMIKMQLKNL